MKFEEILRPITKADFFSEYWNVRPVVISGNDQKFAALPSTNALPSMCAGKLDEKSWHQTSNVSAQASIVNENGKISLLTNVPISMYSQLYNTGYSLCFGDVSYSDSRLTELIEDASGLSEFRSNILVTCYLTPPQSSGILHFDHQHVFFLQREGTKYWRISEEPAVSNPIENFLYPNASQEYFEEMSRKGYKISIPSECGFRDVELKTGDLLYMPPGYYHVQHTGDRNSFHYTLTLETISFWSLLTSSLHQEYLKNCSQFNNDIRMLEDGMRRDVLEKQLDELKSEIRSLTVEDMESSFKSLNRNL